MLDSHARNAKYITSWIHHSESESVQRLMKLFEIEGVYEVEGL